MFKFIIKIISLYKMFNFDNQGNLCIKYNGSKIKLTKEGDIALEAKRHLIYRRRLSFNGCDETFIQDMIKAYDKGEHQEVINRYNLNSNLDNQIKIKQCQTKEQ